MKDAFEEELEKEIEENREIFNTLEEPIRNRIIKDFARVTEGERLHIIKVLEAKLEGYKKAKEDFFNKLFTLDFDGIDEELDKKTENIITSFWKKVSDWRDEELKNKLEGKK